AKDFVRWSQGPRHGGSGLAPDFPSNQPRLRSTLTLMKGTTFSGDGVGHVGIVGIVGCIVCCFLHHRTNVASAPKPTTQAEPFSHSWKSQGSGITSEPFHQNSIPHPMLSQMALLMKLPLNRWPIALSHAATVRKNAPQYKATTSIEKTNKGNIS